MNKENNQEQNQEKIKVIELKTLKNLWAWQILTEELKQINSMIEDDLFEVSDNKVIYSKQDLNREIRKILELLIEMPDNIIKELTWVIEVGNQNI